MYLIEELEPSLVASEPRLLHSDILLFVDDRIALVKEDLVLLGDNDVVDTTPPPRDDDRVKGLWKQNIARTVNISIISLSSILLDTRELQFITLDKEETL